MFRNRLLRCLVVCSLLATTARAQGGNGGGGGGSGGAGREDATSGSGKKVDHVLLLEEAIADPTKIVICQTAPSVRVAIGELFGLGTSDTTPKLVNALRKLGFDYVFDTLSGADLTTMEESNEFIGRLNDKLAGNRDAPPLPQFTSCCPGWVDYVEKEAPELMPHLSSCKSPHMMVGAVVKEIYAEQLGAKPEDIVMASIMPCYMKQFEADRIMMQTEGGARHVDHVVTTKQLGAWVRQSGIDYAALPDDGEFDPFMGISTGSGAIYGNSGGVTEAALRTTYELVTGERLDKVEFPEVRGLQGVKEASVVVPPNPGGPLSNTEPYTLRVLVVNGLASVAPLVESLKNGTFVWDFMEVMDDVGGCIMGPGQPESDDPDIAAKRAAALYSADERATIRRAHENPAVLQLYKDHLGQPNSEEAERLLHTYYVADGPELFDWRAVADGEQE